MKNTDQILAMFTPRRLAIGIVLIPFVLATLYFSFFAADRYVSESVVVVRQAREGAAGQTGLLTMLTGVNPASTEDTLYLQRYILSMDMMSYLDKKLDLRKHYEAHKIDFLYHLPMGSSQEKMLEYYQSRVSAHYDDQVGLLVVSVEGFDSAYAQLLNRTILQQSETFINEISHQIAREQLQFALEELGNARSMYDKSKKTLITFQNEHGFLDPMNTSVARSALISNLEAEIAKQQAERYAALKSYGPNSATVQNINTQIEAMRQQLQTEVQKLIASGGSKEKLNQLASQYETLMLQARIAEEGYKTAVAGAENARVEGLRKLKTLAIISQPTRPDEAFYPRIGYDMFTLLVLLSMLYGIARFTVASIRDHKD